MRVCRFNDTHLGVVENDTVYDVTSVLSGSPLTSWPRPWGDEIIAGLDALRPAMEQAKAGAPTHRVVDVRLNSPVARPPKIMAAPANYVLHIDESKADAAIAASGPIGSIDELGLFLKSSTSLVGFGDGIRLRFPERRTDHEAEFAIVIGQTAANLSEADALDCVAGYSIGLDITLRGSEERSFRKSIDSYTVLGPWLVTKDEIADPDDVAFQLRVNGNLRQDAKTDDMIFSCRKLISLASKFYTLYPGDVILTGAPAGVGQIVSGDIISINCGAIGEGCISVA